MRVFQMTGKGKRLTYLTVLVGLVVFVLAGVALKHRAVEQWYLWKLESEDEEERKLAAEKLAEMCSVRAISKPGMATFCTSFCASIRRPVQLMGGWRDIKVLIEHYRRANLDDLRQAGERSQEYMERQRSENRVLDLGETRTKADNGPSEASA